MQENTNPPSHTTAKIIKMCFYLAQLIALHLLSLLLVVVVVVVVVGHSSTEYLQFDTRFGSRRHTQAHR